MPLTDLKIRAAKPRDAIYRMTDGGGLYLEINPNGGRYWRYKYRYAGKEKRLALGVYPTTSLADARARLADAKAALANGVDPGQAKQDAKRALALSAANSFEAITREWHGLQAAGKWTEAYAEKVMQGFEKHIFPTIGHRPIKEITPRELLEVLRAMQKGGTIDRANRLRQSCGEVFRYGIATEHCDSNPAADLVHALQPSKQRHFAALTKEQLPTFLQALTKEHRVTEITRIGLRLLSLTFVRPGELRQARWSEFDLKKGTWEIPAERMKMRESHIVPLSTAATDSLKALHAITGNNELLFPGRSSVRKPISDNTFRTALHDMGFQVTAHGFRSTASTILNELGFRADVIERQLSHGERNKVRKAYNRAQYLDERREMMEFWGNYIAALEAGSEPPRMTTKNLQK